MDNNEIALKLTEVAASLSEIANSLTDGKGILVGTAAEPEISTSGFAQTEPSPDAKMDAEVARAQGEAAQMDASPGNVVKGLFGQPTANAAGASTAPQQAPTTAPATPTTPTQAPTQAPTQGRDSGFNPFAQNVPATPAPTAPPITGGLEPRTVAAGLLADAAMATYQGQGVFQSQDVSLLAGFKAELANRLANELGTVTVSETVLKPGATVGDIADAATLQSLAHKAGQIAQNILVPPQLAGLIGQV